MDNEFRSQASQVSATYGVDLDGSVHQYVGLYDAAWANGILESGNQWPLRDGWNPNQRTISVETVDDGQPDTQPVTDEQYDSVRWLFLDKVRPAHPEMTYLLGHHSISPLSRSCPASRWYNPGVPGGLSRLRQLADDIKLNLILGP